RHYIKKAPDKGAFLYSGLTLLPLLAAAGFAETVFLALDFAAVAGQEAFGFQARAQGRLEIHHGAGAPVAYGAGLTGRTATVNGDHDVEFAVALDVDDRLLNHHLVSRADEVFFERFAVDDDLAFAALQPDTGGRSLATAGGIGATLFVQL